MTYLVVHPNQTIQEKCVQQLVKDRCKNIKIKKLSKHPDIHVLGDLLTPQTSIGIDEVKSLQKQLKFYPMQLSSQFVIIWHAETLTVQAQNALLKNLEDHQKSLYYILVTGQKDSLLSTVLSRCYIIYPFLPPHNSPTNSPLGSLVPPTTHICSPPTHPSNSASPSNIFPNLNTPKKPTIKKAKHKKLVEQFTESIMQQHDLLDQFVAIFYLTSERSTELVTFALQDLMLAYEQKIKQKIEGATLQQITIWQQQLSLVQESWQHIRQNANKRLVLENLVLKTYD